MDHLPLPKGGRDVYNAPSDTTPGTARHMLVPYLEGAVYDGKGFDGALERLGLSEQHLFDTLREWRPDDHIDSCLQQYLFFALLAEFHAILRLENTQSYVRQLEDGQRVLTTKPVIEHTIPAIWEQTLKPLLPPQVESQVPANVDETDCARGLIVLAQRHGYLQLEPLRKNVQTLLRKATRFHEQLTTSMFQERVQFRMAYTARFRVCLCANLLLELLIDVAGTLLNYPNAPDTFHRSSDLVYGYQNIIMEYTRRQGWCPFNTAAVDDAVLSLRYVAAMMPSYGDGAHEDCTNLACTACYNRPARRAHLDDCDSNCGICYADEDVLSSILRSGDYPVVIGYKGEHSGELKIIPAADASHGYIAISHVWRHGLGNETANSIPSCQIKPLFGIVHAIGGEGCGVWLDTVCVPASAENTQYRKQAIRKMRDTYQYAKAVIVIDKLLQRVEDDPVQRRLCIVFCDWIHRVWTLQEFILPGNDKVFLKLRNREAVPLTEILKPFTRNKYSHTGVESMTMLLTAQAFQREYTTARYESYHQLTANNAEWFEHLARSFQRRDTTKPGDEAVCLATLLGIEIPQGGSMPSMEYIYSSVSEIPASFIFVSGPRLPTVRFRSLPRSFRRCSGILRKIWSDLSHTPSYTGRLTDRGFHVQYPGYFIEDFSIGIGADSKFVSVLEPYDSYLKVMCMAGPFVDKGRIRTSSIAAIPRENAYTISRESGSYSACIIVMDVKRIGYDESLAADVWSARYLTRAVLRYNFDPDDYQYYDDERRPHLAAEYRDNVHWILD